MIKGDTKLIGSPVIYNGVAYQLKAVADLDTEITLEVVDGSGNPIASQVITQEQFKADPTCAAQVSALNALIAGRLSPAQPSQGTGFLADIEAFLGKLSLVASDTSLQVSYTA
jgi:hypothetical protein